MTEFGDSEREGVHIKAGPLVSVPHNEFDREEMCIHLFDHQYGDWCECLQEEVTELGFGGPCREGNIGCRGAGEEGVRYLDIGERELMMYVCTESAIF
jgi:hypothetical protein